MGLLTNLISPNLSAGGIANANSAVGPMISANPGLFFNGGIVGYDTGGLVNHGVPNRDSVLTGLARGEFVIRKNAVDSLGAGFLSDLNKRGSKALDGMGGAVIAPSAKQEMNVWLVAQDEKPQLGPQDVLTIVSKDILKDGATKRLIRHVAQGG